MCPREIVKVYKIVSLDQQYSDFTFWQAQPYQARLDALEQIRHEYHRWKYRVQPGFQRVYKIVRVCFISVETTVPQV